MVTPINHVIAWGAQHFGDFRNILPSIAETKKVLSNERQAPWHCAIAYVLNLALVIALRS